MALFNIFLEKDDPNQPANVHSLLTLQERIEGWANEFVKKDEADTNPDELQERTDEDTIKARFIKPDETDDFLTSVVLSKKILDIMMQHPDFYGIRISLGINKDYVPGQEDQPSNCFVVIPVNNTSETITDGPEDPVRKLIHSPLHTYYCANGTGFPPRHD